MTDKKDILKADKEYQKKLFLFYALVVLVVFVVVRVYFPKLVELIKALPTIQDQHLFFSDLEFLFLISFTLPALIMIRTGVKIMRQKQYPWKGMKTFIDTPYKRGKAAVKYGRRFVILGIITFFIVIGSAFSTQNINRSFVDNPMGWISKRQWDIMNRKMQASYDSARTVIAEREKRERIQEKLLIDTVTDNFN